jgi:hypothetical protein
MIPNRIAWAPWRTYKWPCVINKLSKDARGRCKVHVNYYEFNKKKGSIFKFDLSKIELFFRPCAEKHFEYKVFKIISSNQISLFASELN